MIALTGYWGYNEYTDKQQLEIYLGNRYQRAFYELAENVEQLQVLLGKSLVSTSPRQNLISLSNIWSKSMNAQQQLTNIPLQEAVIYRTAKYLSQTGDYAMTLARRNAEGKLITEEEREQLKKLREQAIALNNSLTELENEVLEGNIDWREVVRGTREKIRHVEPATLRDGFDNIQQDLNRYPTLIYDGPFSDHVVHREPKEIEGEEITQTEAEERAREVIDVPNIEIYEVTGTRKANARIEAYNFTLETDDNKFFVDISEKGGKVINIINNRVIEEQNYSLEEAASKAKKYLASIGYPNMEPTYGEIKEENSAFLSFSYKPEDIVYYPDLITVQIALDNNQVMAVEAQNYLFSHHQRKLDEPELDEEDIRNMLGERFEEIENISLAVIPQENLEEVLTYEVRGVYEGETYLVYFNAETGVEEEILQLFEGSQGTFSL